MDFAIINRAFFPGAFEYRGAVRANDPSSKSAFLQREAERASQKPGADDRDLANRHARKSFVFLSEAKDRCISIRDAQVLRSLRMTSQLMSSNLPVPR
jgi:hypothetical protein